MAIDPWDFEEFQADAAEMIEEVQNFALIMRTLPPDPITGGDPVPTYYPAMIAPVSYDQRYVNGTSILTSDRQIFISAAGLPIAPTVGDFVLPNAKLDGDGPPVPAKGSDMGQIYHVIAADPNNYDGLTNVVFIVQGRIA